MRLIHNISGPACLEKLKLNSNKFTDLKNECLAEVRTSLSANQQGYCAYCEQKFKSTVFIDHYIPQSIEPDKNLDIENFLGVCSGKEYFSPKETSKHISHCGDSKKQKELQINPKNIDHINEVYYENDGAIRSKIPTHDHDLNSILNLNFEKLKELRDTTFKNSFDLLVITAFQKKWSKKIAYEKALEIAYKGESDFTAYLTFRYKRLLQTLNGSKKNDIVI